MFIVQYSFTYFFLIWHSSDTHLTLIWHSSDTHLTLIRVSNKSTNRQISRKPEILAHQIDIFVGRKAIIHIVTTVTIARSHWRNNGVQSLHEKSKYTQKGSIISNMKNDGAVVNKGFVCTHCKGLTIIPLTPRGWGQELRAPAAAQPQTGIQWHGECGTADR